ncbi:MAG: PQQ-binding-like beta-propeller repeat protein [Planctomycetota bacterium]|jgi:outer membrane protein assembly factor BamB
MLKIRRYRLLLLVSLLVLSNVSRCLAAAGDSLWLVSPELLKHAKLKKVWQAELVFDQGEQLRDLYILGNRIYALSNRNYIVSLNREKGGVIFERSFGAVGLRVLGLGLYNDELFSIVGSELVEVNPEFGTVRGSTPLEFGAVCPPARNNSYFYLGGADGRIYTLRADDKVQVFKVAAGNDSMITSIMADENFVVFGTEGGNLISITPNGPTRLWQFDAAGGIAGPVIREGESLFFASKDTNVYRIDMIDNMSGSEFIWKYQTAAMLDRAPRVTPKVVYQHVLYEGLFAINRESGKPMWEVPGGIDLLTEAAGKAYVMAKGRLVVMDNKKSRRLYSVNFAGVSRYASNLTDSKIYIANKTGRIVCLQPVK